MFMSKKKKEKITYIDDGRTLADMSALGGGIGSSGSSGSRPRSGWKDIWNTYWSAVKMMFVPMLVVVGAIVVIYLVMTFLFLVM